MSLLLTGVGSGGGGPTTILDNYAGKFTSVYNTGLIAYWRLNETASSRATDYSAEGNHALYVGPTLDSTEPPGGGTCPFFDGVNDNVFPFGTGTSGFSSDFNWNAGTAMLWVNRTSAAAGNDHLIVMQTTNSSGQIDMRSQFNGTSEVRVTLVQRSTVTDTVNSLNSSYTQTTAEWLHVAFAWDASSGIWRLYLDGTEVDSTDYISTDVAITNEGLSGVNTKTNIMERGFGSEQTEGHAAHVAVWNTMLSAAKIADLASTIL